MAWQPITLDELQALLTKEATLLDAELKPVWEQYSITPYHVPCTRLKQGSSQEGIECMFVVAQHHDILLIYDDVEDEFGIAILGSEGILRTWGTYGTALAWTLRQFAATAKGPPPTVVR